MNQNIYKNRNCSVMVNIYDFFGFPLWRKNRGDGFCKYEKNN